MQINTRKKLTKFRVCTNIRNFLLNDESIKALVDNRIYPIIAPEGTLGDYIVYVRDSYGIQRTHQGIYQLDCTIFISCVSTSYDRSQDMAELVFKCLENVYDYADEKTAISSIQLDDSTEDKVNDLYVQTLKFIIK